MTMHHPDTRTARGEAIQLAVFQRLELSEFCTDAELLPIFTAIANVHNKYLDQIEAMRRERQALANERALAEQGRRKR
jgi:hypothetical protein